MRSSDHGSFSAAVHNPIKPRGHGLQTRTLVGPICNINPTKNLTSTLNMALLSIILTVAYITRVEDPEHEDHERVSGSYILVPRPMTSGIPETTVSRILMVLDTLYHTP